jgi:hypothetical protein
MDLLRLLLGAAPAGAPGGDAEAAAALLTLGAPEPGSLGEAAASVAAHSQLASGSAYWQ